ncbi:MAG: MFS transporter [Chloroflexi bacterium]|nr:MFS transporter [Chloroflexota bacterium]
MATGTRAASAGKTRFFYGYIITAASFIILGTAHGGLNSFGVFFAPMLSEFGWSRAVTSGAFSLANLLGGILSMMTGRLNDRFGPRVLLTASGAIIGLGYFLISRTNVIWQLYLSYGVIIGIAVSCIVVPLLSTLTRWFVRRRGMVTGIAVSGTSFGGMVIPLLAGLSISRFDWRVSFFILGTITLVIVIASAQLLKRDPRSAGLLPYGEDETGRITDLQVSGSTFQQAARSSRLWMVWTMAFCAGFAVFLVLVHIVIHATDIGIPAGQAVTILAVSGGFNMAGRVITGIFGDRFGPLRTAFISFIVMTIALFWLLAAKTAFMLYLFAALFGFASGGPFAMVSMIVADIFGLKAHGVLMGLVNSGITLGGTLGPVLAGYIFDTTGSYRLSFTISIILCLIALVLTWLIEQRHKPQHPAKQQHNPKSRVPRAGHVGK